MVDFTYTVFLVVASVSGLLVTLFAAGIIGTLLYSAHEPVKPADRETLPRAA